MHNHRFQQGRDKLESCIPNFVPTRTIGTLGANRRSSGIHCMKIKKGKSHSSLTPTMTK